jgi:hypothetical protein
MIKSRSPYYYSVPLVNNTVTCDSYKMNIRVWNGSKTIPPNATSYTFTKFNPTQSTGNDEINIARVIADFIIFSPNLQTTTGVINSDNQRWIKIDIFYDGSDIQSISNIYLMNLGYSFGMDGKNQSTPSNNILLNGNEFKVAKDSIFVLPILINEPTPAQFFINISLVDQRLIYFTYNFTSDFLQFRYRQTGDATWINYTDSVFVESPIDFLIPLTGSVEFQVFAFSDLANTTIFSNIFTATII